MEMTRLVVTVDFDMTLVFSDYPHILGLQPFAKEVMQKWSKQGIYLIINTCRNGEAEWECETFLFDNKVPFNKINDHAPFIKQKYFNPHHPISKKLFSHINIDDTSLNFMYNPYMDWLEIDQQVQDIIFENNWNVRANFEKCKIIE